MSTTIFPFRRCVEARAKATPIAVTLQDLDAVIVVRPFDSLSDDSKRDVALVTNGADVIPTALTNADVTIDSRYGYWDPETAQVVAFNT